MAERKALVLNSGIIEQLQSGDTLSGVSSERWTAVSFTRASDSTFTVTDNAANQAIFMAGRPIRYRATSGTWYYGIVVSYSSGTVTLDGVALTTSVDDEMQYGSPEMVRVLNFVLPGNCIVADPYSEVLYWSLPAAYCVRSVWKAGTAPSGANITGNIEINGSDLHASEISLSGTSEVDSGTDIQTSYYDIQFSESVCVTISQVGSSTPGGNPLYVALTFIIP